MTNYKIVSIEGNIGSGKTTLLENLKKHFHNDKTVIFLKEPVDEWEQIKDKEGNTMLQKFYADQVKYSFAFQMMAYISRLKILRNVIKHIETQNTETQYVIITERSLYTDRHVFAKMLHDQGKIEDVCYQIYLNWFDEFVKDFKINYYIYVKADPNVCYDRIHTRARNGEELIPLAYLNECHIYHEEFLTNVAEINNKKLVLDGNKNIYKFDNILQQWINQINNFIL